MLAVKSFWGGRIMKKYVLTEQHIENFRKYLVQDEKSKATIEKYIRDIMHLQAYLKNPIISIMRLKFQI